MKKKAMSPAVKLILSALSIMLGIVWLAAGITVFFSLSSVGEVLRAILFMLFPPLFLWLGIRGLMRWYAEKNKANPKKTKIILAVLGVLGVLLVIQSAMTFPYTWRVGRMNRALKPFVKNKFASSGAALPQNPYFVFYNMETGSFSIPGQASYAKGTDEPDKVNVVVGYTESVNRNGRWVSRGSGRKVSDAYSQGVRLYIIRLDDWSLIAETSFSEQLGYNENGTNVLNMNQVKAYLNSIMK